MDEVSENMKAMIERATYLRGRILTSYSQVEFLLADISVKLGLKFPYLVRKRISAVKRIADRPGFEIYQVELERVCDDLLRYDELRNFMAHGFMMLHVDKIEDHRLEYRMYQRDGEDLKLGTIKTTIPILSTAAEEITRYVSHAVSLFSRIYLEKRLERGDDAALTEWS